MAQDLGPSLALYQGDCLEGSLPSEHAEAPVSLPSVNFVSSKTQVCAESNKSLG